MLEDLDAAMAGVAAVYYLVHTIGASSGLGRARPAGGAERARRGGGGRGRSGSSTSAGSATSAGEALSPHLASRHEVGRALAAGPVPVTELRAAVIIGAGSASFEMLRYLVDVLPVMVTPRWVETRCQPIAVRDVLRLLVGVLAVPEAAGQRLRDRWARTS